MIKEINDKIDTIFNNNGVSFNDAREAKMLYNQGFCEVVSRSKNGIDLLVQKGEEENSPEITLKLLTGELTCLVNNKPSTWSAATLAALLQAQEEMELPTGKIAEGKAYTRLGMIKRVLAERRGKAAGANYKLN